MSENSLSEKQRIEKAIGQLFLNLYNALYGTSYTIVELSDSPDVRCQDSSTGRKLELEITLLEDLPGEVAYVLGKARKPVSPTTGMTTVSFFDDSMSQLGSTLAKKLRSSYGKNTALVIKQVSPFWEPKEWEIVADRIRESLLKGKEGHYGAGVWIICTDTTTWPASDTLFCLSEPAG